MRTTKSMVDNLLKVYFSENLIFDEGTHRYFKDGVELVSVTTWLGNYVPGFEASGRKDGGTI
mgnify:CR=1 FL=1